MLSTSNRMITSSIKIKEFTSLFQSVRAVIHIKMIVCITVPPSIPDHIPCMHQNNVVYLFYNVKTETRNLVVENVNGEW